MKRPEISTQSSDPELVGSNEASSWVVGRNCVYRDSTVAEYRVSIHTPRGWRSYGHFNDLETATYIANIAILVERCEEKYQLNEGVGEKNREELDSWRRKPGNLSLEKTAGERYKSIQSDLAPYREQERIEAKKAAARRERQAALNLMWDYYSTHRTALPANISEQREVVIQLLLEGATPADAFAKAAQVQPNNTCNSDAGKSGAG